MKIIPDSHLDHGLTPEHVAWLLEKFADRMAFFLKTVELPPELPPVRCALHGPLVGESPVPDGDAVMRVRGERPGPSRTCARPFGSSRLVTVIAGPHDGELFTAYGGPVAPREPWDPSLDDAGRAEERGILG